MGDSKGKEIRYRKIDHDKYKYQMLEDYPVQVDIYGVQADDDFISLTQEGLLTVKTGYCWDGPSGPAPDIGSMMRASLVHDALYQLIREGRLGYGWRKKADKVFREICIDDGLDTGLAYLAYWALRKFGGFAARPKG